MCQFRDCPDTEDVEALAEQEGRPLQVLVRQRPGAGSLVDGYVLQRTDTEQRTAVYTWVQAGDPDPVAAYLLDLLAEVCPPSMTGEQWWGGAVCGGVGCVSAVRADVEVQRARHEVPGVPAGARFRPGRPGSAAR